MPPQESDTPFSPVYHTGAKTALTTWHAFMMPLSPVLLLTDPSRMPPKTLQALVFRPPPAGIQGLSPQEQEKPKETFLYQVNIRPYHPWQSTTSSR